MRSRGENVVYAIRNVVESELVHGEVPEISSGGGESCGFLAVFVSSVVSQPDIVASFYQGKGKTSLFFGDAHPNFAVHKKAMMKVDDRLLNGVWASIDEYTTLLFALSIG